MKYIILCGGEYTYFSTPRQLVEIKGERIVDRTIRLLKENGIKDIYISSNNPLFDDCGVERLENKNNNYITGEICQGYWLDAFYPINDKVCYIFGDVYFSDEAIKKIVNYKTDKNVLFGTIDAKNERHHNIGEPFAYIVNDYKAFFEGIQKVKELYDKGETLRHPIVWELYRYLNKLDVNVQQVLDETYEVINDYTIDLDTPEQTKIMKEKGTR